MTGRYPRDLAWWMFELVGWLNEWKQKIMGREEA